MKRIMLFIFLFGINTLVFGQSDVFCDFQQSCSMLLPIPDSSGWHVGTVNTPYFSGIRNGFRGLVTDSSGYYGINRHDSFEIHFASGAATDILRISHVFHTDSLSDGGYIEASYDGGVNWQDVRLVDTNFVPEGGIHMYSRKGGNSPIANGRLGFTGSSGDTVATDIFWLWYFPLKKMPDSTFLRFHFISDSIPDNKEGWLIYRIEYIPDMSGGLTHTSSDLGIRLFPNPSYGVYQIDANSLNNKAYLLQIFDLHGKVLLEKNADCPNSELDLRAFDGKLFLYRILTEDGKMQSGRLVKE